MDDWTGWAAALLAFLLSLVGINMQKEKKRYEDNAKDCAVRNALVSERLTRVESEFMTEREVRKVLTEYFDPFMRGMVDIQKDVQDIKIHLARLPRRKSDLDVD